MLTAEGKNNPHYVKMALEEDVLEGAQPAAEKPRKKRTTSKKMKVNREGGGVQSRPLRMKDEAKAGQTISRTGKGGKLRNIMNMPIEVFAEVCSYLDPLDLRHLALSSKQIRNILMAKQARRIWKDALESVYELPECPVDLNEPQYVRLMYSAECDTPGCNARGTQVDWFYRLRYCKGCFHVKMTDASGLAEIFSGLRYRSWFPEIIRYYDSSQVLDLTPSDGPIRRRKKQFYIEEVRDALATYMTLLQEPNHQERVKAHLSLLENQCRYRIWTGSAMKQWHGEYMALRAEEITARKNARLEGVKAKLVEAGWDPIDFPLMCCKEFRALVFKDQQLTPGVWKNIKPKLEPLLQKKRDDRLQNERRQQRAKAFSRLYFRTANETLGLSYKWWDLRRYIPDQRLIQALPKVEGMLQADTETMTKEQWLEVAEEVRVLIWRHWRYILQRVVTLVDLDYAPPADSQDDDDKSKEELSMEIEALTARLERITASFVCRSDTCEDIHWFPEVFLHTPYDNAAFNTSGLLEFCKPLDEGGKHLINRMSTDLGLDANDTSQADVKALKNLICTRCDPNIAKYSSFSQIAKHYFQAQAWFSLVQQVKQLSSHPHKVINDHDWLSDDASLVKQDKEVERVSVESLQAAFRFQAMTDPSCDMRGIGGEDFRQNVISREIRRYCMLCPQYLSPWPCPTSVIKIHIRAKHGKEPDLDTDTSTVPYVAKWPCPT